MWLEEKGYREEIVIGNGIEWNGKLWCSCSNLNYMCCIDIADACVEKRIVFDRIPRTKRHSFSGILAVSECLYLIPFLGKDMVKYNIDSGEIEYIDFGNLYTKAGNKGLFIAGCRLNQYLFLFPYDYQNIIRFDTQNKQIVPLPMPKDGEKRLPFIRRCALQGNSIWIMEDGGNRILQVDVEKMQSKWFLLRENIYICDFCMWEEKLFCLDTFGKIIIFDTKVGSEVLFADIKSEKFGFIEKSTNYIWLIPKETNQIIRYSEKKGIEEIKYPESFVFSPNFLKNKSRTFSSIYSNELETTIMPRCNNVLIKIDKKDEKVQFIDITYSKNVKQEIKQGKRDMFFKKLNESSTVSENEGSVEWFLEFLKEEEKRIMLCRNNNEMGYLIYQKDVDI